MYIKNELLSESICININLMNNSEREVLWEGVNLKAVVHIKCVNECDSKQELSIFYNHGEVFFKKILPFQETVISLRDVHKIEMRSIGKCGVRNRGKLFMEMYYYSYYYDTNCFQKSCSYLRHIR